MKKVIVIDDEPLARSIIIDYLQQHPNFEVVAECGDGFEGAKAIQTLQPDLIFLDVQMPKISGFELLEILDDKPQTIFTTAFDEYAIKAFEQHAIDYLLKPISQDRFDAAIQKFQQVIGRQEQQLGFNTWQEISTLERVVVKTGPRIHIIPVEEIHFIQADDDYIIIHTAEAEHVKKATLASYEKRLNSDSFVRVHRSFLINISQLNLIEPFEKESHVAVLKSGKKISVSKSGYTRLKHLLGI